MLIKQFLYGPFHHSLKLISDRNYLNWCWLSSKLRRIPRFTKAQVNVSGLVIAMPDVASFLSAYKEIFVNGIYAFKSDINDPKILDLGANIGLSVLFFKKFYPHSKITAFEADPNIFKYLHNNLSVNGYNDINLINKAVWDKNDILRFYAEGADGGRVASDIDNDVIEIEAVDINEHLENHEYDFLKMDIEGAEDVVLPACRDHLGKFKFIFLEYHSKVGQKQSLSELISLLSNAGFRLSIQTAFSSKQPFLKLEQSSGFDLQLNIFAYKD